MSIFSNPSNRASDEATAYVEAVLTLVGDRDPVEILKELPESLVKIVGTMSDAELRAPEAPGKWSAAVLLAHLADGELVWAYRLRMVLAEADAVLTGYDQERWVEKLGYRRRDPEVSLREIEFLRHANLRLLEGLSPEEFERSGRHSERGRESVRHMVKMYAGHDLVHRRQLERIRTAVSGRARVETTASESQETSS
jgi:uncharacterized damage-inducible protein DinB